MKTISEREINYINLFLGIIILLSGLYIGYKLSASKGNIKPKASSVIEKRLATNIGGGFGVSALQVDMKLLSRAIDQENQDQNLATKALNVKKPNNLFSSPSQAELEINHRLALLDLSLQELKVLTKLNKTQVTTLKNNVDLLILTLRAIKQDLLSKGAQAIALLNDQYINTQMTVAQVDLVKVADDQQVSEQLLNQLRAKLAQAIQIAAVQGVAATNLQADLTTINGDVVLGTVLSKQIENTLASTSQVSSARLTYDNSILLTAKRDIVAASVAAQTIINDLISS